MGTQSGTIVSAVFYYGTASRTVANLWTSGGNFYMVKFPNILSTMQALDPAFTYSGKVGALWLSSQDAAHPIQAQARTVNGNFGKTFQGLAWTDSNTANVGRNMMIMNLTQNTTYRTFVGFLNALSGGGTITVQFGVGNDSNQLLGSYFTKTFQALEFQSFNPFVEAGIGAGTYDNCWLYIQPTASASSGVGTKGLIGFGSSANNTTNDSSSHIAVQLQ